MLGKFPSFQRVLATA